MAPGDTLPMAGLDIVIMASGGAVLDAPLAGAGSHNPYCDGFTFQGEEITSRYGNAEDDQSIATFVGFGQFRSVIMGDLNWNQEHPADVPRQPRSARSTCTSCRTTARKPPAPKRSSTPSSRGPPP